MNNYLKLGLFLLIISWLFVGFYRNEEPKDNLYIFLKHKPSLKLFFHTPIGMQDLNISDLSPENQLEQKKYNEFIIKSRINNQYLAMLPFLLIQAFMTLLIFGTKLDDYIFWRPFLHYIINIPFSIFGIAMILTFDRIETTIFIGVFVLIVNYLIFFILNKKWTIKKLKKPANNSCMLLTGFSNKV